MIRTAYARSKLGSSGHSPLKHGQRRTCSSLITCLVMNSNSPFWSSSPLPQDRTMSTMSRKSSFAGMVSSLAKTDHPANNLTQLPRDESFHVAVARFQRELRQTETNFLVNLGRQHKAQFSIGHQFSISAATIFSSHMETLCTLMGAKPCVLYFMAREGRDYGPFYDELIEKVHLPLFTKNRIFQYGFALRKIKNDVHIQGTHPTENWKGAWMLVDTRDKMYEVIEQEILKPQPNCLAQFLAGRALGYPVLPMNVPLERRYVYIDKTATQELAALYGEVVDDVIGLDYVAPAGSEQENESQEHFEGFRKIGRTFGREYVKRVGFMPFH